jgi:EAL domain-containing protein (putative c-di-GMP-specific phosphodiesterase class I)
MYHQGFEQRDSSAADAFLQEARRQVARAGGRGSAGERVALVLHLSRLSPPAPRPHHRRVARALMQDTAEWHEGQLFALGDGDLALLCREAANRAGKPAERPARVADAAALPEILRRLLRIDTPPGLDLVSVWKLGTDGGKLLDYAQSSAARRERHAARREGNSVVEEDFAGQTGVVDALGSFIGAGAVTDLMQRQSAVTVGSGADGKSGIRPLYHEVTFSIAGLEERVMPASSVASDPFLFRHLAARLDRRMLEALCLEAGGDGPLNVAQAGPPALHLNLTVPGILSADFSRLVAVGGAMPGRIAVEISLLEAVADVAAFARARARLAECGFAFVLDGVSHLSLLMTRPALLGADLVKLDWSPRIGELADDERVALDHALRDIDLSRVVLHRAETEAALRWGLARGIRRFQGRHVDAMLGASRIVSCGFAGGCALRQCIERAAATSTVGRSGCLNRALLDAAAPPVSDPLTVLAERVA